uniref:uncharacterized protein LOC131109861 n=1 Tax=Doryrhamphus excisus TaxID=161450 RepID=UPI0025AE0D46|nr:uncharacterized protein LOC131109861 [Doryrhamphus excisus]
MANLSSGCSSSVLENDTETNWENIPPALHAASYTQKLDSEYFPDITLVDVTRDFEMQPSDSSVLKSISASPLSPMESVGKIEKVVPHKISRKDSAPTPRMKVNKANRHLESNASVCWLYDECLPDITDLHSPCGFIPTTDISSNPTFESNMEHGATLNRVEATKNNTSQNMNGEPNSSVVPGLTGECALIDPDSLPSCKKAKTCVTSNNKITITETTSTDEHHNTVNGKPQANSTITMLESSSSDTHPPQFNSTLTLSEKSSSGDHNTFDANPSQSSSIISNNSNDGHQHTFVAKSSHTNDTVTMSDSSSSHGHHNTFDTNLPSKNNDTTTMSDSHHHHAVDANPSSQTNGTVTMSDSSSSHHNTFDTNPPSKNNDTTTMSDSHHHHVVDANPSSQTNGTIVTSESSSCNGTFDINPPQFGCTITRISRCSLDSNPPSRSNSTVNMPESHSVENHQNTREANPLQSGSRDGNTVSESSSTDVHHNAFDANVSQSGRTLTDCADGGHQRAFNANPPSRTNGKETNSQKNSNDGNHNTFDANVSQSGRKLTDCANGGHQGAFNANPPSQTNGKVTSSQGNSSIREQSTFNANLSQSGSIVTDRASDGHTNGKVTTSQGNSSDTEHNTFNANPPQSNSTLPVSESDSSKNNRNTFDARPPPQSSGTITMSEKNFDAKPPCLSGTIPVSDNSSSHNHNGDKTSQSTGTITVSERNSGGVCTNDKVLELLPGKEFAPSTTQCETKDPSESLHGDQSIDTILNNKAKTLNLDDTLDLQSEALITSTPMTSCKMYTFVDRDEGKVEKPKSLDGDAASKPAVQTTTSNVASNHTCDRKTLFSAKSLLPAFKPATQLLKFKPASLLPGQGKMIGSGLTMMRRRPPAEPRTLQESSAVSSSYNLRPSTMASKLPKSGLERLQLSARPSSLPKVLPLSRLPPTRSSTLASSSAVSNTAVKIPQTRKHNLVRDEPVVKKTKMDVHTSAGHAVASASSEVATSSARTLRQSANNQRAVVAKGQKDDAAVSTSAEPSAGCEAASRTKSLKMPVTNQRPLLAKGHGCANCVVLERELKRLKEELKKYKKEDDM